MSARLLRLFGLLLVLTALAVTLSRAPDRPVESLVARWALPPSDFIEVKGQLVHIRDEGPRGALPIVLLHGTGASLHTWEGWSAALRKQYRVITFDLPGFGLTGPFAGQYPRDDYRREAHARFVLDVMEALKLQQRVVIGGNSLGGEVAWLAATLAPDRFARLILVDAAGYPFASESVPIGFRIARLPVLSWIGQHLLPRGVVAASLHSVYGDPSRVTEALVDRYFELALREGNRRALGLGLRQFEPGAQAARIQTIALPTLIVWGARDRLIPPADAQRFAADIRGSRLVVFDALGHVPQEEDPAATVQPVLQFLQQENAR